MRAKFAVIAMFLLLAGSSSAGAGCWDWGYKPPDTFGDSFRQARSSQVLNPEAEDNLDPVEGLDGRAAKEAMKGYVESFGKALAAKQGGGVQWLVGQNAGGGK